MTGIILPLVRALESESAVVRTRAAESLALMGYPQAVEPLARRLASLPPGGGSGGYRAPAGHIFVGRQVSYVQGFEVEIATGAAVARPVVGTVQPGVTLDVRVHGVAGGTSYATETRTLRRALARLTGAKVSDSNAAWTRWWRTQGEAWMAEHAGP